MKDTLSSGNDGEMRKEPKPEDIKLGERIERVRLEFAGGIDPAKFAEPLEYTRQAVVNWERGHGASRKSLSKIALVYDVDFNWLATGIGDPREAKAEPARVNPADNIVVLPHAKKGGIAKVPVLSMVSASNLRDQPGVTLEDIRRWINVADLPSEGDWIALEVDGDSMNLVAPHGATILVNRADDTLIDKRYYVFALEDGAATFKQFRRGPDRLQPYTTNPEHFSIPSSEEIYVVGRVRRVIHDI